MFRGGVAMVLGIVLLLLFFLCRAAGSGGEPSAWARGGRRIAGAGGELRRGTESARRNAGFAQPCDSCRGGREMLSPCGPVWSPRQAPHPKLASQPLAYPRTQQGEVDRSKRNGRAVFRLTCEGPVGSQSRRALPSRDDSSTSEPAAILWRATVRRRGRRLRGGEDRPSPVSRNHRSRRTGRRPRRPPESHGCRTVSGRASTR